MEKCNWTSKDWSEWLNTLAVTREKTGKIDPHPATLRRCAAHFEEYEGKNWNPRRTTGLFWAGIAGIAAFVLLVWALF